MRKRSFICLAGLATAGLSLFRVAIALAQEIASEPAPIAEAERIIVVGSNIPSAEQVGANPVLVIDRDRIDQSGERTAEELIKKTSGSQCAWGSNFEQRDYLYSGCVLHLAAWFLSQRDACLDRWPPGCALSGWSGRHRVIH